MNVQIKLSEEEGSAYCEIHSICDLDKKCRIKLISDQNDDFTLESVISIEELKLAIKRLSIKL